MKKNLFLIFTIVSLNIFCQTQADMNKDAYAQFQETDKELNKVYKQIIREHNLDTLFVSNLKKSQRIWVKFRDAELSMKFPDYKGVLYGSMYPICRAFYLKELTENRVEILKEWIVTENRDDSCNNSLTNLRKIETKYSTKAYVWKDGSIDLVVNMKRDHRIFGYRTKNIMSEKLILISIFTNEVKNNPFGCKYGAYYETSNMKKYDLEFISKEGSFLKVGILENGEVIDKVFMKTEYFEFEE